MIDTIFALATAPGRAAVAVMRLSGPDAGTVLDALMGRRSKPRVATLRTLRRPGSKQVLDQALVLWLPGPTTFTGEDVVELHLHGGRAVVGAVAETLAGLGLRPAEPGEFTRRAFEHGRLDLAEAEAVADLVDAETEAQRRQALGQLGGALSHRAERWRAALIDALAGLEAAIDFADEDLPETVIAVATPPLLTLQADLALAAADVRGQRVREGFHVALIGAPNAGKSTLLNALAGRDAAIVTAVPGTTRDVIEVIIDIAGYRVVLADTAGLREAEDLAEQEGVRRAEARAQDADLRLWIVDRNASADAWRAAEGEVAAGDLLVLMKSDLPPGADDASSREAAIGKGLKHLDAAAGNTDAILTALADKVIAFMEGAAPPMVSRLRHRTAILEAQSHIARALSVVDPELMADDVRLAARALERISGRIDSEVVLDRIFSAFCIGK